MPIRVIRNDPFRGNRAVKALRAETAHIVSMETHFLEQNVRSETPVRTGETRRKLYSRIMPSVATLRRGVVASDQNPAIVHLLEYGREADEQGKNAYPQRRPFGKGFDHYERVRSARMRQLGARLVRAIMGAR